MRDHSRVRASHVYRFAKFLAAEAGLEAAAAGLYLKDSSYSRGRNSSSICGQLHKQTPRVEAKFEQVAVCLVSKLVLLLPGGRKLLFFSDNEHEQKGEAKKCCRRAILVEEAR